MKVSTKIQFKSNIAKFPTLAGVASGCGEESGCLSAVSRVVGKSSSRWFWMPSPGPMWLMWLKFVGADISLDLLSILSVSFNANCYFVLRILMLWFPNTTLHLRPSRFIGLAEWKTPLRSRHLPSRQVWLGGVYQLSSCWGKNSFFKS